MNAACCRLTGIDAHLLVGKPVSALLSIPLFSLEDGDVEEEAIDDAITDADIATIKPSVPTFSTIEATVKSGQELTTANEKGETLMTIDQLILTSGCDGHLHLVNVKTKLISPSVDSVEYHEMLCRLSIAPIVVSKDIVSGNAAIDNHEHSKRARYQYNQAGTPDISQLQQQGLKFPSITHFVIQFKMYDNEHYDDSMESLSSSNSVDGQLTSTHTNISSKSAHQPEEIKIGATTGNNNNNNNVDRNNVDDNASNLEGADMDGSISVQTSSDREAIVAVG